MHLWTSNALSHWQSRSGGTKPVSEEDEMTRGHGSREFGDVKVSMQRSQVIQEQPHQSNGVMDLVPKTPLYTTPVQAVRLFLRGKRACGPYTAEGGRRERDSPKEESSLIREKTNSSAPECLGHGLPAEAESLSVPGQPAFLHGTTRRKCQCAHTAIVYCLHAYSLTDKNTCFGVRRRVWITLAHLFNLPCTYIPHL